MTTQLDLTQAVTERLSPDAIGCFFDRMGSSLTNDITPSGYQAYVQVITWAILERFNASDFPQFAPLEEDRVSLIVDRNIRGMCNIIPEDLGYPDPTPSGLKSRVIWWSLKVLRRELL